MTAIKKEKRAVVGYLVEGGRVLLGLKKRRIAKGLWIGFGGFLEEDEDYREALIRELNEELGITVPPNGITGHANLSIDTFAKNGVDRMILKLSIFRVHTWDGAPTCTRDNEEFSEIKWFEYENLPWDMPAGDRMWIGSFLQEATVRGSLRYSDSGLRALSQAEITIAQNVLRE